MSATIIVGTQFGDEGKGKVVDYYTESADIVVRYNGGSNAGHTIVTGNEVYKLHLIPSGVFHENKTVVIGNGVVVDPEVLLTEISVLQSKLSRPLHLKLSDRAHIVMPYHKVMDELEEKLKGGLSAGTTKRGIGPCYSDKSARFGIRVGDLMHEQMFREKIDIALPIKEKVFSAHGVESSFECEAIIQKYLEFGAKLKDYVCDTSVYINRAVDEKKNVLLEGAQGTFLDVDHGIYPYGTSSNPVAGGACTGAGIGPTRISRVIGVAKAYTSRVGEGPFPTELENAICDHMRQKGAEFGTTTGRPRRCGWLDMVMIKYAVRVNGITALAVTKLDVLGGLKEIKVAKQYCHEGNIIKDFPSDIRVLRECSPVYDQFDGWDTYTKEQWRDFMKKGYHKFPENLVKYIDYIEKEAGIPVELVSFGQDRELTIRLQKSQGPAKIVAVPLTPQINSTTNGKNGKPLAIPEKIQEAGAKNPNL